MNTTMKVWAWIFAVVILIAVISDEWLIALTLIVLGAVIYAVEKHNEEQPLPKITPMPDGPDPMAMPVVKQVNDKTVVLEKKPRKKRVKK